MRIVKEGTLPDKWYRGTCTYCKTVFECTPGEVRLTTSPTEKEAYYTAKCPLCSETVKMREPKE